MRALNSVAVVALGCFMLGATPALAKGKSKTHAVGVLNLNTASAKQLDDLPGVGNKAAKLIIEYRTKTPFARIDELVKVKGFGKKRFEKLKPFLAVAGNTTLKLVSGPAPGLAEAKPDVLPAQGRTPNIGRR